MHYTVRRAPAGLPKKAKSAVEILWALLILTCVRIKSLASVSPRLLRSNFGTAAAALAIIAVLVAAPWGLDGSSATTSTPESAIVAGSASALGSTKGAAPTQAPGAQPATEDWRAATEPSSRGGQRSETKEKPLTFEESFILSIVEPAQASQRETRVPASVTIAQAILESDWGRSGLARKANNYFGIKARPDPGSAGVIYMDTWESLGGRNVTVNEPFRAYNDLVESFVDHGKFLSERPFYKAAFNFADDAKQFAREIHKAGYATDPAYSSKLIALMDKLSLYQYDLKPGE